MEDLKSLRTRWQDAAEEIERIETADARTLTIQEGVREFRMLYHSAKRFIGESEPFFHADREAYLIEMQRRLQRLASWQEEQRGRSVSQRRQSSADL